MRRNCQIFGSRKKKCPDSRTSKIDWSVKNKMGKLERSRCFYSEGSFQNFPFPRFLTFFCHVVFFSTKKRESDWKKPSIENLLNRPTSFDRYLTVEPFWTKPSFFSLSLSANLQKSVRHLGPGVRAPLSVPRPFPDAFVSLFAWRTMVLRPIRQSFSSVARRGWPKIYVSFWFIRRLLPNSLIWPLNFGNSHIAGIFGILMKSIELDYAGHVTGNLIGDKRLAGTENLKGIGRENEAAWWFDCT